MGLSGLSLANPLGLLALLGIPVILAIHLFQRRSRTVTISTLFLLEQTPPRSLRGAALERLRRSASLWLQLGAVALIAWLLVQPRWLRADSIQRVILVLDGSVSMSAFRPAVERAVAARARRAGNLAGRTEWTLLTTDLRERSLYSGKNPAALQRAIASWEPKLGTHDPRPALGIARSLAGRDGRVIFVTDHESETVEGTELLAIGSPIDNFGFTGVTVETQEKLERWRAVVKNHGRAPGSRSWRISSGGREVPGGVVPLAAGESQILSGTFPSGARSVELILDPDAFTADDRLPIVLPEPKRLTVETGAATGAKFVERFESTLDAADLRERSPQTSSSRSRPQESRPQGRQSPGDSPPMDMRNSSMSDVPPLSGTHDPAADLTITSQGPGPLAPPGRNSSIVFLRSPTSGAFAAVTKPLLEGPIVAENDPLLEDLTWQGLLVRDGPMIHPVPEDRILLWQGTRPLIFLRAIDQGECLAAAFDVEHSNVERLAAFVLLLHRFVESIRSRKVAPETANVELNQRLDLSVDPSGSPITLRVRGEDASKSIMVLPSRAPLLRAPARPGFFEIRQADRLLLTAASHFSDAREADLRSASSRDATAAADRAAIARNTRPDPLTAFWILFLGAILVTDWTLQGRKP